ncbi:MAG: heme biosynthesis HemY N-terminal domain-containing protein [Parvibaculum sp.]|nr:heme biosynthesis HemY N-terminal domain-containing protein [Parvibaculum sp.]
MLRALYIFLVIAVLAALGVWLADNPGELVLDWRGYELRTSFVIGFGFLVVLAGLVLIAWRMASGIVRTPASVSSFLDHRRRSNGFLALSRGMVAVAAGDAADAKRHAARAQKLLADTPLTLLLAAQAAQLEGRDADASAHFEAMLKSPETAFLGLRGLFVQARRAGDRTRALELARQAFRLRPNAGWAAQAVFEIEAAEEDWGAALRTLDASLKAKQISRNEARRRRMVMLSAQAMAAAEAAKSETGAHRQQADEMALRQAMLAVALDPTFAPVVALAAKLNAATGHPRKGAKLIEAAWGQAPHPELAEAYMGLVAGESSYDRFKRMQLLVGRNREHVESRVALARAAIGARDWLAARGALEVFVGAGATTRPTQRICELMAEIEEGEFGNRGSAREWLSRALQAPEDAAWTGEAWRSHTWTPINPATGEFDALTWREPGMRLAGAAMPVSDDDAGDDMPLGADVAPVAVIAPDPVPVPPVEAARDINDYALHMPDDPGPDGPDDLSDEGDLEKSVR